jgi:hypothetical protein
MVNRVRVVSALPNSGGQLGGFFAGRHGNVRAHGSYGHQSERRCEMGLLLSSKDESERDENRSDQKQGDWKMDDQRVKAVPRRKGRKHEKLQFELRDEVSLHGPGVSGTMSQFVVTQREPVPEK